MTPDEFTIQEHFIEVGDGHTLYVQDWGNKDAKTPIIFLHGGPGGGCSDSQKNYFDPKHQRVIFFDQRGCGRSVPYGSLERNTTQDLVDDIEKIATHLSLTTLIISGRSWGSCLGLAYALKYPKRVRALVLGGIFTGSQEEIDWVDKGFWHAHWPDAWDQYLARTPKKYWANPTAYHAKRILSDNQAHVKESGWTYAMMESSLLKLDDRPGQLGDEEFDPAGVRLEVHYMSNRCFMPDRYILNNAHKLAMPVWLIQGHYDFVCPPRAAYELNAMLPHSQLVWTIGGHSGSDRETWTITRTILQNIAQV